MANQRPIRRGRIPFRGRRKRREARWIDAFSASSSNVAGVIPTGVIAVDTSVTLTDQDASVTSVRELIIGDDYDWSDDNNVLLERLVGSINVRALQGDDEVQNLFAGFPLIRMAVLAVEDAKSTAAATANLTGISLWANDSLQEYEWMWLWQSGAWDTETVWASGAGALLNRETGVPVDIRTRRSIGQKDRVVLLASYKYPINRLTDELSVQIQPMLRAVVTTR